MPTAIGKTAYQSVHAGFVLLVLIVGSLASRASAQAPPFFGGGVVAFDPQVSILQNGVILDVQPTVSHDRKYVQMNIRATNSNVRALVPFPVSTVTNAGQGFVGGVNMGAGNAAAGANPSQSSGMTSAETSAAPAPSAPAVASPDAVNRSAKSWILTREGMYLVKPLK